jgi:hypothetical protein
MEDQGGKMMVRQREIKGEGGRFLILVIGSKHIKDSEGNLCMLA